MKYSARKNVGDGKFPNRYWVSESNDYYIREKTAEGVYLKPITEHDIKFKSEGKTYPKAFKTYKEAIQFADTLCNDRITIEDRLCGQVFECIKVVCPCCGKKDWESFDDTKYTKERMEKAGYKFE